MDKYYYIHTKDDKELVSTVMSYAKAKDILITLVDIENFKNVDIGNEEHILLSASLKDIKKVLQFAVDKNLSVGIIPRSEQKELKNTFALPSSVEKALEVALVPSQKKIDLLYCNENLVLQEVVIGEVPPLDSFASSMEKLTIWERVKSSFSMIKKINTLSHTSFKITTAKDKVLNFSAIGAVGVEYNNRTFASKLISKHIKFNDGRMSLVILSPSSIFEYISYIFQTQIVKKTPKSLPKSVGYIHSNKIDIETKRELSVTIDSIKCDMTTPITLETTCEILPLSVGEKFWERSAEIKETKEGVKVEHLPSDDEMSNYLQKSIPLFSHASYEQFSSLFSNLRQESRLSSTFMTLLILATIIATFGLYINSPSVIIGAMLLAPLMQPIVGASMGLLRQDNSLFLDSAKTILIGVTAVMFSAMFISWLVPIVHITSEMNGRLSPTILDMLVAIVSGIAAAYAKSNEKIIGSLAGVAIAVALVPPLAVSGIGLGWGNWSMFSSALLLFITNLVGIVLAAAFTFFILGFSPVSVAKKGIFYALLLVAIVSIPLSVSFSKMKHNIFITEKLSSFKTNIYDKKIYLKNIVIHNKEVRCEVVSSDILSSKEKKVLKKLIAKEIGEKANILVSFWYEL